MVLSRSQHLPNLLFVPFLQTVSHRFVCQTGLLLFFFWTIQMTNILCIKKSFYHLAHQKIVHSCINSLILYTHIQFRLRMVVFPLCLAVYLVCSKHLIRYENVVLSSRIFLFVNEYKIFLFSLIIYLVSWAFPIRDMLIFVH